MKDILNKALAANADTDAVAKVIDAVVNTPRQDAQPKTDKEAAIKRSLAVEEALAARELIKISVLQNCLEDPREMAQVLAERTHSQVVQVIGKKIVLYREGKKEKKKIELPK